MNNKDNIKSCVNHYSRPEWERWTGSNICPRCCSDEIEYNTQLILTSNPPKAQLRCKNCDFYFTSSFEAEWTNKDVLDDMWKQDQSILNIPKVGDWPPSPQPGDWPPSPTPCDPLPSYPGSMNYGWVCPKCGAVLAPHVSSCPHCSPATTINITY